MKNSDSWQWSYDSGVPTSISMSDLDSWDRHEIVASSVSMTDGYSGPDGHESAACSIRMNDLPSQPDRHESVASRVGMNAWDSRDVHQIAEHRRGAAAHRWACAAGAWGREKWRTCRERCCDTPNNTGSGREDRAEALVRHHGCKRSCDWGHGVCRSKKINNRSSTGQGTQLIVESHGMGFSEEFPLASPTSSDRNSSVLIARVMLMVIFAGFIGGLFLGLWHFVDGLTTKSIKSLARGLRIELLELPVNRMWFIFNSTLQASVTYSNLAKFAIANYAPPLSPENTHGFGDQKLSIIVRNISWAIFTSHSAVSGMVVVHGNGAGLGYSRNINNTMEDFYIYSGPPGGPLNSAAPAPGPSAIGRASSSQGFMIPKAKTSSDPQDFIPDSNGDASDWFAQHVNSFTGYDVNDPPKAVGSFDVVRTFGGLTSFHGDDVLWHVIVHDSYDTPLLACGSPVRDPASGNVVAVAGVLQALTDLNSQIKHHASVKEYNITMYLSNAEGFLLASSTSAPLVKKTAAGPSLIRADESLDVLIKGSAQRLLRSRGSMLPADMVNVHMQEIIHGEDYYIDSFVLNLTQMPTVAVVVTPRNSILGVVYRGDHMALVFSLLLCSGILIVGFILILIFTRPLSNKMKQQRQQSKEMKLRLEISNLTKAREIAEASNTYKSQFLANMSHELRTPMAAVIGLLDILLSDEYLTSEQGAMVSQIRQCSTSLLRLLNNILDLSKVESGKLLLEEVDFDLRFELEGLVELFSVQCSAQQLEIVLDLADNMPRLLRGDSTRVVQVFANLIANSIKFTSSGYVHIRGRCDPDHGGRSARESVNEETGLSHDMNSSRSLSIAKTGSTCGDTEDAFQLHPDMICLSFDVDDTGCGIDPSKWETVFGSFEQADLSTTRTYGGTGLGLCIVRSLIRCMGGEIKVSKKDGPGTMLTFHMYIKQSPDIGIEKSLDHCNSSTSTFGSEKLQASRLVFALKAPAGRMVMSTWMTAKGLRVFEMATWEDTVAALEKLVVMSPDDENLQKFQALAILDISLVSKYSDVDVVDRYMQQGVMIGWLLNHDTSTSCKGDLRRRGYSIMTNKPLYKSKLLHLLRMLVGLNNDDPAASVEKLVAKPELRRSLSSFQYDLELGEGMALPSKEPTREGHLLRRHSFSTLEQIKKHTYKINEQSPSNPDFFRGFTSHDGFPIYCKPVNYLDRVRIIDLGRRKRLRLLRKSDSSKGQLKEDPGHLRKSSITEMEERPSRSFLESKLTKEESGHTGLHTTDRDAPLMFSICTQEGRVPEQRSVPAAAGKENLNSKNDDVHQKGTVVRRTRQEGSPHHGAEKISSSLERHGRTAGGELIIDVGSGIRSIKPDGLQQPLSDVSDDDFSRVKPLITPKSGPLPVRHEQQPLSRSSTFGSTCGSLSPLKGIRILLAEDTLVLQKVATIMLEKLGASVVPVADGLQVLNALKINSVPEPHTSSGVETKITRELKYLDPNLIPIDLVLMDCQMPKMDGYAATKAIRDAEQGTGAHIPIVALTAHCMSSDEAKCLDVGMDAYLTKPIDRELLTATITSYTKNPFSLNS